MTARNDRMPINYNKIEGLNYIDCEDLLSIELNAKVLELPQCFELLFIVQDELPQDELEYCQSAHKRGRHKGLTQACDHLFRNMQARNGTNACIEYLRQFSGTFQVDIIPSAGSATGFNFNVIMPEDKSEAEPD